VNRIALHNHNTGEAIITTHSHSTVTSVAELPKAKQTNLALYVTAKEAYGKWEEAPEAVKILDVRTPEEYIFVGHPEMAVNIPLAFQTHRWSEEKGYFDVAPNPEFVTQVAEWAKPSDVLLAMCRSGGRSAMAVNLLAQAGFKNAYNIIDGMEGDLVKDPDNLFVGKRMKNGWKNSGLPWTYDVNPDRVRLPKEHP
jgi:rhodanese-related sulfurtransferase